MGVLKPEDYADAVQVQDACNLSGVIFAFARVMQKICDDDTKGTAAKNNHPIAVLFADKIHDMTVRKNAGHSVMDFHRAYDECCDRAGIIR